LERDGIYQSKNKTKYVCNDIGANSFPIGWQINLWEILYGLSKMGYGKDARLNRAWDLLDSKLDADGRMKLDWTHAQSLWKIGKKDENNEWLTFYVLLAQKYRG